METLDYLWIVAALLGTFILFNVITVAINVRVPRWYDIVIALIGALTAYTILIQ